MKKKKRILFFYSDLGDGGIQRLLSVLSRELHSDYDFYISIYNQKQLFPFYGKIIQLYAPSTKNIFIVIKNIYLRMKRLTHLVIEHEIDLVISHSLLENALVLLAKKIYGFKTPLVITFHSNIKLQVKEMGMQGKIFKWIVKRLAGYAEGIMGVSNGIIDELAALGIEKHKLKRIYNPLFVTEILRLKKEKIDKKFDNIFKLVPVIISTGRLVHAKNYSLLIRAFRIVKRHIDCNLVILGDGYEKGKLQRLCEKFDLQNSVYLLGWVQNPYKFVSASTVYVLSSVREGFPNVLIEAMLCGKPVVATDCNHGPREIIEHAKSGFLVPVNDEDSLADSIVRLLTDAKLYKMISKNSETRARDFSSAKIKGEYISYINSFFTDPS